jgi:dTDP-4-dehydrorhamnose 3,5-epimerase
MDALATSLDGVLVLEPPAHHDDRGFFFESWSRAGFEAVTGIRTDFVLDGHSGSKGGVVRGLHYQLPPDAHGKLVRVTMGAVFDVAVDLRKSSPTFRQWYATDLTAQNRRQIWVPPGFAHGFLTTSEWAEVQYKLTGGYSPPSERALRWDDPDLAIAWPLAGEPILSARDAGAPALRHAELFD